MAIVERVRHRIDMGSLQRDASISQLELNDVGRVVLRTDSALMLHTYRDNRIAGSFVLIDEATNATVAAGMALETRVGDSPARNITWDPAALSRPERWRHVGQRGATVWLTGLPAAGKSTIAVELERRLLERGVLAYRLDGDNLRHGLNADLGFDPGARTENVRRVAEVAKILADAGVLAIVSLVSPYRADRDQARAVHEADGLPFIEAWVDTPVNECERRDPKGLYARARRGDLPGLTGIDDPYEPPDRCELVLDACGTSPEQCVERLLGILIEQELLPAAGRRPAPDA
jgi:bifunctional enzyme CysN/CysC